MTGRCLRCGVSGETQRHHPTGRAGAIYIHPSFTVTLCLACHESADRVRRLACPERVDTPAPAVIVARLAAFFGWWGLDGAAVPAPILGDVAGILECLVADLRARKGRAA